MNRFLVSVPLFVGLIGLSACSSEEAIPTDIKVDPIEWSTCDEFPEQENLECGSLAVPLNYADVEGEKIEISLVRIPAANKKSKGVVLSNPGGPGSSGVDFVQYWSAELVENIGLEDFDIVGFDPRGVGRSGALTCLSDPPVSGKSHTPTANIIDSCHYKYLDRNTLHICVWPADFMQAPMWQATVMIQHWRPRQESDLRPAV